MGSGANRNMSMLGYIAGKALVLQKEIPEIVVDWDDRDISQKDIAKNRGLVILLDIEGKDPENIAASVVRTALRGFDEIGKIKGFPGLVVDRDVYERISNRHRQAAVDTYNQESPTGFVNLDEDTLRDISESGVKGRGRILIKDGEKQFAYECSVNPDNIGWRGINWGKVSGAINDRFYDGKNVRTKRAARGMVDTYKEKF